MSGHPRLSKMVAKEHLERSIAIVELQFEVVDIIFKDCFMFMTKLTNPVVWLLFPQKSTILDSRQGVFNFLSFSMQLNHADNSYSYFNELLSKPTDILMQPGKQTVIYIKSQVLTQKQVTGVKQPSSDSEDNDNFFIWPSVPKYRQQNSLQYPIRTLWNNHIR